MRRAIVSPADFDSRGRGLCAERVIDQHRVEVLRRGWSLALVRVTAAPQRVSRRSSSAASSDGGATTSTALPLRSGAANAARRIDARQRDRDTERRALTRRAIHRDAAVHALDDAPRDGEAEARAAELAAGAAFGLLEFEEDARLLFRRDADAGVAHLEHDLVRRRALLDHDADAARFGELDGVAGEIEQHLAQPRRVAGYAFGHPFVDVGGDLEALGLGARTQKLDDLLDQRQQRERARLQFELAGFDLGEVQDLLDQRQQRVAGGLGGLDVGGLLGRQRAYRAAGRSCRGCR